MLDFGAGELVVIGVVALVAIGPKELPGVLRTIGRSVGKMRRMAGDFQNQFSDAMREMELEEARKKVEAMGKEMSDSVADATKDSAVHIDSYLAEHAQATPSSATPAASESQQATESTSQMSATSLPSVELPAAPSFTPVTSDAVQANLFAHVEDTAAKTEAQPEGHKTATTETASADQATHSKSAS